MTRQLSNGYGAVTIEDGRVYGWRDGQLIGDLPLPLTRHDALLVLELCLTRYPGSGTFHLGVTADIFVEKYLIEQ